LILERGLLEGKKLLFFPFSKGEYSGIWDYSQELGYISKEKEAN
jgi:hypothetical protein